MKNFAIRLKELREERDLRQLDLAKILGVPRANIAGYESQGREPNYEMLCRIAEYFGVTVDYLLGRDMGRTRPGVKIENELFYTNYDNLPQDGKKEINLSLDELCAVLNQEMSKGNIEILNLYSDLMKCLRKSMVEIDDLLSSKLKTSKDMRKAYEKKAKFKEEISGMAEKLFDETWNFYEK